jgi:hypothetical protein
LENFALQFPFEAVERSRNFTVLHSAMAILKVTQMFREVEPLHWLVSYEVLFWNTWCLARTKRALWAVSHVLRKLRIISYHGIGCLAVFRCGINFPVKVWFGRTRSGGLPMARPLPTRYTIW